MRLSTFFLLSLVPSVALAQQPVGPGNWFPEYVSPFQEGDSASDEDRQYGEHYARVVERLVAADCPDLHPFEGTNQFGETIEVGETVHIRTLETCLRKQVEVLVAVVSTTLDSLYGALRRFEREVAPAHMDSMLTNGLVSVQSTWLQSRDARCTYEAAPYSNTGATTSRLLCNVASLKQHREWAEEQLASTSGYPYRY